MSRSRSSTRLTSASRVLADATQGADPVLALQHAGARRAAAHHAQPVTAHPGAVRRNQRFAAAQLVPARQRLLH